MKDSLESLSPEEAVELYLEHREAELSEKTLINQRYRLNSFVEWCEEYGLTDLNDLSGRDLHRFRTWRATDINGVTLRGILATIRVFLEFCAGIDAVEPGLRERVKLPEIDDDEAARDIKIEEDRAKAILDYLDRFRYASRDHVILALLWHTGIRLGSLRAFDVTDFDREDRCIKLRHRPKTGTPLKNGKSAERTIAVGSHYAQVLTDYLEHHRYDVKDQYGRQPLLTSKQGRLSATPIRVAVYMLTRPCIVGGCPHDRDPDSCEFLTRKRASEYPSSLSPHGVRRGSITKHLRDGTPEEVVSDRMNVSGDVLDQHYDRRTEREKMEVRREFISNG